MEILLALAMLAAGLGALVYAGDKLVDGSVALARQLKVSDILIGVVVIGFGTSMPEVMATLAAAWNGSSGIALGNIIGSNISNIGLIMGSSLLMAAHFTPMPREKLGYAFTLGGSLLFAAMLLAFGYLTAPIGVLLLLLMSGYIWISIHLGRQAPENVVTDVEELDKKLGLKGSLGLCVFGLAGLLVGAELLVRGAIDIAGLIGVPEEVIGLSIVAIGSSLPELAAAVSAARKNRISLTVGNILGSNLFNMFVAAAIGGLVMPLSVTGLEMELDIMLLMTLLLLPLFLRTLPNHRLYGGLLLLCYGGFIMYLGGAYI